MEPQKQSGTKTAKIADLSAENLQETENRANFAQSEDDDVAGAGRYVNPMLDTGFK